MQTSNLFVEYGSDMPVRLPLHKNPGLEIVYIKRGNLILACDGDQEIIMPESVYFTLPWQEHGSTRLFESGHDIHFIVIKLTQTKLADQTTIQFPPEIAFDEKTDQSILHLLCNCSRHTWPASALMRILMPEILAELTRPGAFHTPRIHTLLKQIILELTRTIEHGTPNTANPNQSAWRLNPLLKTLDQHYGEKWTLESMAKQTGLKRSQLNELFKYATGESPLNYLISLRILKSMNMIQETTRSITDIALDCGFSSSQHFTNTFKKKTGQTPMKYRTAGLPEIQIPRITS